MPGASLFADSRVSLPYRIAVRVHTREEGITMAHGLLIPENEHLPVERLEASSLAELQAAVGGNIEFITIRLGATIVVDEEGKIRSRPLNRRATLLWWLSLKEARGHDVIVGPAFVAGLTGGSGELRDLELLADPMSQGGFQIQVRSMMTSRWESVGSPIGDYFEAARQALLIRGSDGWPRSRVIPARK
jgi:hypothetical protein